MLTTWRPEQFSYDATARSTDGGVLQASRYSGDRLDWYNFLLKSPPAAPALRPKQTAIPTPVSFVVFGVTAALPALARRDGAQRTWRMFELRGDPEPTSSNLPPLDRPGPWLYLPDALLDTQYGAPIEEVRLLRDEQSNLGWGVERVVEGPDGLPRQRAATRVPAERRETWAWRAMTDIPRGWIPLLPSRLTPNSPEVVLLRAGLPGWTDEDGARGSILGAGMTLLIPESEIQATGVTVQRLWQRSRHSDGSVLVWLGRRRWSAASGPGVALAFDRLER